MRVDAVELRRVELPLVAPFRTSYGEERVRRTVLVRVLGDDGAEGWGECVALPEPLYTSEWADGAFEVLRRHLAPRLVGGDVTPAEVAVRLAAVQGHPMAKASLEMAVLDAVLRAEGRSLAAALGAVVDRVPAGVSLGLGATVDDVAACVERGYRRVKVKVAPGEDAGPVRALRAAFPSLPLQVDANGAYSSVEQLRWLDELDLVLVEQPLAADDLAGHAALAAAIDTPVCLDEAITSARAAMEAIAMGACSVVNVKAGRVGGYLEAVRVHDACRGAGVAVWCGGMIETGLGRSADLALAALPGFTVVGDVSPSDRWFEEDLTPPVAMDADGTIAVPTGPGIGTSPLADVLARRTIDVEVVRPG
jgi:o-succinylbenzoate synthase